MTTPRQQSEHPRHGQDRSLRIHQVHRPDVRPGVATRKENQRGEIMEKKRRRGRPPTFLPADRKYLAKLIRQNGIAGAQRKARLHIGSGTLIKIAREYGIVLPKGRRPKSAA
jgi:hypothetical protein